MIEMEFNPENFEEKWFDNWTVVFFFEKNKDEEFSNFLNHSNKGQRTFFRYSDIKNFLATTENKDVKIYITIGNERVKPFLKVDLWFLIDLESYVEFQRTIRHGKEWWTMKAFLMQTFNIHNSWLTLEEKSEFIIQSTTTEDIIEITKKLPLDKQKWLLWFLKKELWEWWNFDFQSNIDGIFLELWSIKNKEVVREQLKKLEENQFANIESALAISKIDKILEIWAKNKESDIEEFWQKQFEINNWVLSQIFSTPMIFIKSKPYCWWKSPENCWWVMSDFWYKNLLTNVSTFIEIKTPKKEIIWKKYRGKDEGENNIIYSMSDELTGWIIQVNNQREIAISEFEKSGDIHIHNAKSLLIIGTMPTDEDEKRSFSLFRNSNKDVEIITFDELFEKIKLLKKIYE